MRTLMALLILLAISAPQTHATVDPDPDGIGVYFDPAAEIWQQWIGASIPFYAYVILTNPTGEDIMGFEFAYHLSVPPGMEGMIFRLVVDFPEIFPINPTLPPYDIFDDEVIAGPFDPIPMPGNPAVVLVTWQFMLLSPNMWVEFYLGPTSGDDDTNGRLAYVSEAGPVPMHVSVGDPQLPVATVNREGVLPVTSASFGSLKALFR